MGREMTYIEAISDALRLEMRRDASVILLGEDIGAYGGAFKVTKGFIEEFGESRVLDTAIAEAAIVGAATGAALAGLRPVAEMQFADFISNAFNQVVNITAKYHYRNFIPVPVVLRLPSGGQLRGGPFHSANPEGWFLNVPGLKIVAPSVPADAKGLLTAAIRDPNPVLYLEHKFLYRHAKGEVPDGEHIVPLGKADVKRQGNDITVVTYHCGVHWALSAASMLEEEGIDVEVVDLRTLAPLDMETIYSSVRKTGKVLVLHEANLTGGVGAEIVSRIAEGAFEALDAPARRLASPDTPVPYAPTLEDAVLPDAKRVAAALKELAAY